jgi:hypothetical protein
MCRIALAAASLIVGAIAASAETASPFTALPGLWKGEGRLGFKDGKIENVTCRATYFLAETKSDLTQNIRCASASGKIEVKSAVTESAGVLSGTWNEVMYNMSGELTGEVTKSGFRVGVKGGDLNATMDIIVKESRQIIEIHFNSSTLLGLTLVLGRTKSDLPEDSQASRTDTPTGSQSTSPVQ